MEDWAGFLKARLDEVEATAEAAGLTWPGQTIAVMLANPLGQSPLGHAILPQHAAHIALHDPARVMRQVKAMRERLALYLEAKEALAAALQDAPPDDPVMRHSYVRERINVNQASGRFTALEASVRLDAAIWEDHPDYPGVRDQEEVGKRLP